MQFGALHNKMSHFLMKHVGQDAEKMDISFEQVQQSDLTTGQAPPLVPAQHDG